MNATVQAERRGTYAEAHPRQDAATDADFERLMAKPAFRPQDLMQGDQLDRIERIAERMAAGKMTVPEYLRGNVGDCMAIAMQAMLWNMDPFAVAQKTHIVSGRLGYEAQLVIAVIQNSGAIRGSFRFETRGNGANVEVRAGAVLRGESEVTWGEWLSASSVTTKNSPLWKTNPVQQMSYLQAKNWGRLYCPGAILGVYSADELLDAMGDAPSPVATMSPAPRAPELPAYPAEDFTKNFPAWRKLVDSGKKTAADLLAMLSTKATFSDEQRAAILALQPAAQAPAEPTAAPLTYAQLATAINATTERQAAELILDEGVHLSAELQADLRAVFERKFGGAQ